MTLLQELFEDQLFHEAERQWDVKRIYASLDAVRQNKLHQKPLSALEKACLRGILSDHSPTEIASHLPGESPGFITNLVWGLHRCVVVLTKQKPQAVESYKDIATWLAAAGYRLAQLQEKAQPEKPPEKKIQKQVSQNTGKSTPQAKEQKQSKEVSKSPATPAVNSSSPTIRQVTAKEVRQKRRRKPLTQLWSKAKETQPAREKQPSTPSTTPPVDIFYGRATQKATLKQWINQEKCRLVAVFGLVGMGKTTLVAKVVEELETQFEQVIWRSLNHTPSLSQLLTELLPLLGIQNKPKIPEDNYSAISLLVQHLQTHRCLIILDDWQAILAKNKGEDEAKYESYRKLLKQVAEMPHQSCLIINSTQAPKDISLLEGNLVRCLKLEGLEVADAKKILRAKGLADEPLWEKLISLYRGNPRELKLVASMIKDVFGGSVEAFFQQETYLDVIVHETAQKQLHEQYQRLNDLERQLMHLLALHQQPMGREQIQEHLEGNVYASQLTQALVSLSRQSLIEITVQKGQQLFSLQPLVMKHIIRAYLSVTSHQSSVISHQSSVISEQAPVTSKQAPVTSEPVPVISKQAPVTSEQAATTEQQSPVTSEQPANTEQSSVTSKQAPVTSEQAAATENKQQRTNNKEQITNNEEQITNNEEQITNNQQPTTNNHSIVPSGPSAITKSESITALPAVHADELMPPISRWTRLGGLFIVGGIGAAVALAAFTPYNVTVRAQGNVRPAGKLRVVEAKTQGNVVEIQAKENQEVKKGDVIAVLNDSRLQTQKSQLLSQIQQSKQLEAQIDAQIRAQDSRIRAEKERNRRSVEAAQVELNQRRRQYQDRRITSSAEAEEARANLGLAQEEFGQAQAELKSIEANLRSSQVLLQNAKAKHERFQRVASSGALSINLVEEAQSDYLQQQQAVAAQRAAVEQQKQKIKRQAQAIEAAKARLRAVQAGLNPGDGDVAIAQGRIVQETAAGEAAIASLKSEREGLVSRKIELQKQQERDQGQLKQIEQELQQLEIKATDDGFLFNLRLRNSGEEVNLGEEIARIVPYNTSSLVIKALVPVQERNKIEKGQQAHIRISTCPYPDFGTLKGEVAAISPDVINAAGGEETPAGGASFYEVTIKPEKLSFGFASKQCDIKLGLEGRADIITREETVLQFLLRKVRLSTDI